MIDIPKFEKGVGAAGAKLHEWDSNRVIIGELLYKIQEINLSELLGFLWWKLDFHYIY